MGISEGVGVEDIFVEKVYKSIVDILISSTITHLKEKWGIIKEVKVEGVTGEFVGGYLEISENEKDLDLVDIYINMESSMDDIIAMVIHEMTHVKQIVSGELEIKGESVYWCNEPYISTEEYRTLYDSDIEPIGEYSKGYKELPWEHEANKNMNSEVLINEIYERYGWVDMVRLDGTLDITKLYNHYKERLIFKL